METQSNIFVPKYRLITYLTPIGFFGALVFWILVVLFVSTISYGWSYSLENWEVFIIPIIFLGAATFETARKIIKAIEFGRDEIVVRYYIGWTWTIGYHEINKVVANQVIDAKKRRITLSNMTNGMELQSRVADILRDKKIQDIDLNQQGKNVVVNKKIIGCALIATLVIVALLGVVSKAGWLFWTFMLITLFVIVAVVFGKK